MIVIGFWIFKDLYKYGRKLNVDPHSGPRLPWRRIESSASLDATFDEM